MVALVVPACTADKQDTTPAVATVFLNQDATVAQRDGVEQRLRVMPGVTGVTFETREEAYERFKEQFKDRPDLVASTRPESLPESFHATIGDASIAEAVELVAGALDGVNTDVLGTAKTDHT